jgi:hypothetical protein
MKVIPRAVKKFLELWYYIVMVRHMAALTKSFSKYDTCTNTHLLHRLCHYWKYRWKISFQIFRISAVAFDLMPFMVVKHVPVKPIFRVGYSQSHSERDPERKVIGWWQECFAVCVSVRYRDIRTAVIANFCPASTELYHATSTKLMHRNVQALQTHSTPNGRCQIIPGTFWLPFVHNYNERKHSCVQESLPEERQETQRNIFWTPVLHRGVWWVSKCRPLVLAGKSPLYFHIWD